MFKKLKTWTILICLKVAENRQEIYFLLFLYLLPKKRNNFFYYRNGSYVEIPCRHSNSPIHISLNVASRNTLNFCSGDRRKIIKNFHKKLKPY